MPLGLKLMFDKGSWNYYNLTPNFNRAIFGTGDELTGTGSETQAMYVSCMSTVCTLKKVIKTTIK